MNKGNILKVSTVKKSYNEVVENSKDKVKKLESKMVVVIAEERATSGGKLEEAKLKSRSKIILQRGKNAEDIALVTNNSKYIVAKGISRNRKTIKNYMEKVEKERNKYKISLERQHSILSQRITKEKTRFSTHMKLEQENNLAKVTAVESKCYKSITNERKKRADIFQTVINKTGSQIRDLKKSYKT